MSETGPDSSPHPAPGPASGLHKLRPPTATPAAVAVTVVIALLLLVVAGIAIRDALIQWSWVQGDEWIAAASRWIADLSWQVWMWPVAVVLVVVGLLFVWTAIAPRTRTHVAIVDDPDRSTASVSTPRVDGYRPSTWTRRIDVARRASAVAREVPGAHSATTTVKRRRATVTVIADPRSRPSSDLEATVRQAVSEAIDPAVGALPVRVRVSVPKSATTEAHTPPAPVDRPDVPTSDSSTQPVDESEPTPDLTKEVAR